MTFIEWMATVPVEIRNDSLWQVKVYRLALFACDIGWHDVTKLMEDRRTVSTADQLNRSLGSTSNNIAEGYSRGTAKARAQFYEYALGSARESRGWYYQSRHILGEAVSSHRIALQTNIIRLLLTMVPNQRGTAIQEDTPGYETDSFLLTPAPTCDA